MMPDHPQPVIRIEGVSKNFGVVQAVNTVSLDIMPGEFFALVGPSGCGKTTLLRILAGFETPDAGRILIDGRDMTGVGPNQRPVNMLFQSYAVFPHMNVETNVAYGLHIARRPRDEIRARTEAALKLVKLSGLEKSRPDTLSGGQRQRVALARALVMRPAVLLLDEPLSALDAKLREAMRLELAHLQKTVGITFLIVTHDQSEALSMADRIAVMHEGRVLQVASPSELYEKPNCRFVADFIGRINLFDGMAIPAAAPGMVRVQTERLGVIELPGRAQGPVTLAVRPEKVRLSHAPDGLDGQIRVQGRVTDIAYFGGYSNLFIDIGAGQPLLTEVTNTSRTPGPSLSPGDIVWCGWHDADMLLLTS